MSDVFRYAIGFICITVLCRLLKLLLPDGKTDKVVSFVLGLVTALSVLTPLFALSAGAADVSVDFGRSQINERIEETESSVAERYCFYSVKSVLKEREITIEKANIKLKKDGGVYSLKKIIIYYADLGYSGTDENIDIMSVTKDVVSQNFNVDKEAVVIYG